jgi:predicted ferric reductase
MAITQQLTNENTTSPERSDQNAWAGFTIFLLVLGGAFWVVPDLLPGLYQSLVGSEPKVFWYLSRATAIFSYFFLWLSLVLGLLLTGKIAKYFPGAFTANDLHQFVSISGISLGLIHGLLLMGDRYIHFNLGQVLIPFTTTNYKPEWVGIGQIGLYLWGFVVLTHYIKRFIGYKTWRSLHFLGYAVFVGVMVHGITAGTDTASAWMTAIYWISGASIVFLTFYRVFAQLEAKKVQPVTNTAIH